MYAIQTSLTQLWIKLQVTYDLIQTFVMYYSPIVGGGIFVSSTGSDWLSFVAPAIYYNIS